MEQEILQEIVIENTGSGGGQFVMTPYKNGYALKRYRGTGEQIIVPPFIEQNPVTAIEKRHF